MMLEKFLILYKLIAKHCHLQHNSISFNIAYINSEDNWIDKANIVCGVDLFCFSYFLLQL